MNTHPDSKSKRRAWLAGVIGTVSVVASLGLVAWELRQNTVAVRSATYDRLAESATVYLWELSRSPELGGLFHRVFEGEAGRDFTPEERTRIFGVMLAFVTHLENSYRQYRSGVVGEDVFDSYGWRDGLLMSPHFRQSWESGWLSNFFTEDFNRFFDDHLEQIPVRQIQSQPDPAG